MKPVEEPLDGKSDGKFPSGGQPTFPPSHLSPKGKVGKGEEAREFPAMTGNGKWENGKGSRHELRRQHHHGS